MSCIDMDYVNKLYADLSLENQFKRILYLNNVKHQYLVGDREKYRPLSQESLLVINEYIGANLDGFLQHIDTASNQLHLPIREIIFVLLSYAMTLKTIPDAQKHKIRDKVIELIRSDEDFFTFINYVTKSRKIGSISSSVQKIIQKYYMNKSATQLADSFARIRKMHGWSHKDLIKQAHFKSDSPSKNLIINYILTDKLPENPDKDTKKIFNIIKKAKLARNPDSKSDDVVPIVTNFKLTINQVSMNLHKDEQVWNAVIRNMSIEEILAHLVSLYKLCFLKNGSPILKYVVETLKSSEKVKNSGIHPITVFCWQRRFEQGGKPIDGFLNRYLRYDRKLTEENIEKMIAPTGKNCSALSNALSVCFNLACSNVPSTKNKRYLVSIDICKEVCIGFKNLEYLEAAVAYTITLLQSGNDVTIATFNEDSVKLLSFDKKISYAELLDKVSSRTSKYSVTYGPIYWATREKKSFDIFVNFMSSDNYSRCPEHVKAEYKFDVVRNEPIKTYRSTMNLPNSKVLTFLPSKTCHLTFIENPANFVEIFGFNDTACKVADHFCRDSFC